MTYGTGEVAVSFGGTLALDRVTFSAESGEVTAVIGGDGAGKSTLLRVLVGLVQPGSGTVVAPTIDEVGYLPSAGGSWKNLTVYQNVAFVGGAHGLGGEQLAARAAPLLSMAGLGDVTDRLAGQLSGGMRKKLGFVLAMLHQPRLVVLDEPTTGVDPVSRVHLWKMISDAAAGGAAIVMSTTYIDEAERASSVLMLSDGRALLEGPPSTLVAAMDGSITSMAKPERPAFAWRSGATFREWWPADTTPVGPAKEPTLEDITVVAELSSGRVGLASEGPA